MTTKRAALLTGFSVALAIVVFLKNAWVTEDAYILFRSVEQLFAGNGPVWNAHERVQTFTSPLWFWLLAGVRLFTTDLYLGATILSFGLFLGTLLALFKTFRRAGSFFLLVLLLVSSTGFFDFTSSGLENGLAYFLIALYLRSYLALFDGAATKGRAFGLLALAGLLACVRHDLGLLLLPATLHIVRANAGLMPRRQWAGFLALSLLPLAAWSIFSLLYYGFPFPNTAYAKLNTGISHRDLMVQSLECLVSSMTYDSMTLIVILIAISVSLDRFSKKHVRFLGYGILLSVIYFVYAGGDFMQGRFLSYGYLVSATILVRYLEKPDWRLHRRAIATLVGFFALFYAHTPLNSPPDYTNKHIDGGVADERGFYFRELSLAAYARQRRENRPFPAHEWADEGRAARGGALRVSVREQIGLYGYFAGLDHIVLDPLALSDPLLARLPVTGWWRVGHYRRALPGGYLESVVAGDERLESPRLNEFYRRLRLVTQGKDLLAPERIREILRFNTGAYNHLVRG